MRYGKRMKAYLKSLLFITSISMIVISNLKILHLAESLSTSEYYMLFASYITSLFFWTIVVKLCNHTK